MEHGRAWMLGGEWKVSKADTQGEIRDPLPGCGAVWTAEIYVEDHLQALTSHMVFGSDRRHLRTGQVGHLNVQVDNASNIRLAPGTSRGGEW